MLQGEHSAILFTCIKLPFVIKIFVLSILSCRLRQVLLFFFVNERIDCCYKNTSTFRLEVWPGYITAVAEQEGGLLLLADASHRVLRTETVLDVM